MSPDNDDELDSVLIELNPGTNMLYIKRSVYETSRYITMYYSDLVNTWNLNRVLPKYRDNVLEFLYHPSRNIAKRLVAMAENVSDASTISFTNHQKNPEPSCLDPLG